MHKHDLLIEMDGTIRFVYADELAPVFGEDMLRTVRASHVEPALILWANDPTVRAFVALHGNAWGADMRPSGGPILGPYATRREALAAERAWLKKECGL